MFRENLKGQIEYKGLVIKELAAMTGISKRTIDTYVDSRAVIPNAEIAVKLAKALDTTVEYLVNGTDSKKVVDIPPAVQKDFRKYKKIIDDLDSMPPETFSIVEKMIHAAAKK